MPSSAPSPRRILVVKLGAFGDFVVALAAMTAIRQAHAGAHITLLTTPPFVGLAEASGLFDVVRGDGRPSGFAGQLRLALDLRRGRF
ncbi:MAG: heptosyltransferase, partial [Caenispirillum sp.]|nr:heptosyltransferase [Caenispirillum sp.]